MHRGSSSKDHQWIVLTLMVVAIWSNPATGAGPPFLLASDFRIGGDGHDRLTDVVVDSSGNAYVAGVVGSYNFPGVDTALVTNAGMDLRFVAKIPPLGRTPTYVAIVGAPSNSLPNEALPDVDANVVSGIALDQNGNVFLVAYESSKDFPVSGGLYQTTTGRKYVYRVTSTGQIVKHSNALDGAIGRVGAIAVDAAGAVYLTGSAIDGMQTTPGAPYSINSVAPGCIAAFAMKLDSTGKSVIYSTYLGYSGTQSQPCGGKVQPAYEGKTVDPTGYAVVVDSSGNAYFAGQAEPGLLATAGALDLGTKIPGAYAYNPLVFDPASHAFVSKINAAGTAIAYTARIGGSLRDRATSIALDGAGAVVIAGKTSSPDFPLGGPFPFVGRNCMLNTPEVGFLAKLSADGMRLLFSRYLPMDGGQLDDCQGRYDGTLDFEPARVMLDAAGNIFVAGYTDASNRDITSTPGAIMPAPTGGQTGEGKQLFQMWSADGQQLLYSTPMPKSGVQGLAMDSWQNIVIANDTSIQRVVAGSLPVDIKLPSTALCAGQPILITARISGSNDTGTVDFQVDGSSVGTATVSNGTATKSALIATGVRKVKATYHGAGSFDGYSSFELNAAINQPGSCP